MGRLIIISNRLPYSLDISDTSTRIRQSSGGLVSALKGYFEQENKQGGEFSGKIWVGSCDFSEEDWNHYKDSLQNDDFSVEPVFIDPQLYSDYYNGFSNSTIWPLFHYFPSLVEYEHSYFRAYEQVNKIFAEKVVSIMQPDDVVWVHDYQLMLLPKLLRNARADATIGFFLHIPFPNYELFRLLTKEWKNKIIKGLLGSDLVGFHTYDYAQYFINAAKLIMGLDTHFNTIQLKNRLVKADLFPIGIDYKKFDSTSSDPEVVAYKNDLQENFKDKKIIFSVDRLDYTKGLTYRLQGYDTFLEKFPEWREKVIFILNIVPSRDTIAAYTERKRIIEEKVSTINGKYSTIQWQPLIYRYNHLPFNELCGLYLAANVALITPLRDGMNLVAKEYVASSKEGGVLILSELTGAASELNEARLVNPTDTSEMANAIHSALTMPLAEQKERMEIMQKRLREYDVVQWVNDFLDQLLKMKKEQQKLHVKLLENAVVQRIRSEYDRAEKRCLLIDYDGTLSAITDLPLKALPTTEVKELLQQLTDDPKNTVFIISGRDKTTLQSWLGHLPLNFIAEHGAFIRFKNEEWEEQTTASNVWKDEIRPMLQSFVFRCAGSFIEEKQHAITWHYRNTHPGLGFTRSRELLNNLLQLTANSPLQVIDGNKVIEVRQAGLDKGTMSLKVLSRIHPDFVLCIGDDTTDEDMFKALESVTNYTVKVGSGSTSAKYNLPSQIEVLPFLSELVP